MKIKIIYGSDTGNTEIVVEDVTKLLEDTEVLTVSDITPEDWNHDRFILGIPTWYDGELQSDWEEYLEEFKNIDFTGKTVAMLGLGDQLGYAEWFCDGIGILGKIVLENGGKLIGYTSNDDTYDFGFMAPSKAFVDKETFYGLCIDEDNQDELTQERVSNWVEQIKKEF